MVGTLQLQDKVGTVARKGLVLVSRCVLAWLESKSNGLSHAAAAHLVERCGWLRMLQDQEDAPRAVPSSGYRSLADLGTFPPRLIGRNCSTGPLDPE